MFTQRIFMQRSHDCVDTILQEIIPLDTRFQVIYLSARKIRSSGQQLLLADTRFRVV